MAAMSSRSYVGKLDVPLKPFSISYIQIWLENVSIIFDNERAPRFLNNIFQVYDLDWSDYIFWGWISSDISIKQY